MRQYVHKNGLTINLPAEFSARENGESFVIEPADGSNKNVRRPIEVTVELQKDGKTPEGEWTEQKTVGNRIIKYRIEKNGGGSGGEEYSFSAYENVGKDFILYRQSEQSENLQPKFNLVRQIIENTSFKN